MFETKMTEMLGIKYPIQCGTMHGLTTAEVVGPFANAGCLCCLPSAYYETKEELLEEVAKVRDQTDQPFGINVGLFPEMRITVTPEERIDWVIESGVKILETAGRSPEPQRKQIADGGLIHIHKCARVRDAIKAAVTVHPQDAEGHMILGYSYRALGDRGLAEEAVQQTFLNAWRASSRTRTSTSKSQVRRRSTSVTLKLNWLSR